MTDEERGELTEQELEQGAGETVDEPEQERESGAGDDELEQELEEERGEEGGLEGAGAADQELAQRRSAPSTERQVERAFKSAENEAARHAKRLGEIFGTDFDDFLGCPLCLPFAPGFVYPADVAPPPEPVLARVRAFLGDEGEPELLPASNARQCDACGGLGRRLSGSKVKQYAILECSNCAGRGFVKVGGPTDEQVRVAGEQPPTAAGEVVVEGEEQPETDPWGRAIGDEDYGVMPIYAEQRRAARLAAAGV